MSQKGIIAYPTHVTTECVRRAIWLAAEYAERYGMQPVLDRDVFAVYHKDSDAIVDAVFFDPEEPLWNGRARTILDITDLCCRVRGDVLGTILRHGTSLSAYEATSTELIACMREILTPPGPRRV